MGSEEKEERQREIKGGRMRERERGKRTAMDRRGGGNVKACRGMGEERDGGERKRSEGRGSQKNEKEEKKK